MSTSTLRLAMEELAREWPPMMTQADIARCAFGWHPESLGKAIRQGRVILPDGIPCGRRLKYPRGVVLAWRLAQKGGPN